jgi:hypothetical protein
MLPPERRLGHVLELIEGQEFFTLHAGRQTGKTTSLMWLERHFEAIDEGRAWRALWVDLEQAREQPDPERAFRSIFNCFVRTFAWHPEIERPDPSWVEGLLADPGTAFSRYLTRLAELDPRPLLILFDEADALVGPAMVSFLTQLRAGYIARSRLPFPASVVLAGHQQVRDPAFNITAEAMTLDPFTEVDVTELLGQHTAATGQLFEPEAVRRIWELGQGHPWMTNVLAEQITDKGVEDRVVVITPARVEAAREAVVLARPIRVIGC